MCSARSETATRACGLTPFGYDGQYTSSDTGLIYLRARVYDPATAQFLTSDPIAGLTLAPYNYVNDNPLNYNDPTGLIFGIPGTPSTGEIAGTVAEGAENTVNALNTAGKAVSGVARYAAPVIDATAVGACVVFSAGVCAGFLVGNFVAQQLLAADQAVYNPNYQLGLNEAAIFAGTGLGATGLAAVANAGLEGLGRIALAGGIGYPQWLLDAAQLLSPEQLEAAILACQ
jgi:RHS repeat-associated protein